VPLHGGDFRLYVLLCPHEYCLVVLNFAWDVSNHAEEDCFIHCVSLRVWRFGSSDPTIHSQLEVPQDQGRRARGWGCGYNCRSRLMTSAPASATPTDGQLASVEQQFCSRLPDRRVQ